MIEKVDSDILSFLRAIYFGSYTNLYKAASSRAYLDMNRTIRFKGLDEECRSNLRKYIDEKLEKAIKELSVFSQEEYDVWHKNLCLDIQRSYERAGVDFTIGQSQKWVNMTIQYLYMLGANTFDGVFQYFHVPIDNYVFDIAQKVLGIKRPKIAWSRWKSYDNQYMEYQKQLRSKIDMDPLRWEFKYWLLEARNR